MKYLKFFISAFVLAGISSAACAAETAPNLYMIGGFGRASLSIDQAEFDAASTAVGNAAASTTSTNSLGWKVGGGYRFNQRYAIEGTYVYFNQATYVSSGTGAFVGANLKPTSWNLFGVATFPLVKNLSGIVKAGVALTRIGAEIQHPLGSYNDASNKTNLAWGLGGEYTLSGDWAVRAEYENFGKAGNAPNFTANTGSGSGTLSLISASALYRF